MKSILYIASGKAYRGESKTFDGARYEFFKMRQAEQYTVAENNFYLKTSRNDYVVVVPEIIDFKNHTFEQIVEIANLMTCGDYNDTTAQAGAIYITDGKGKNKGKNYITFEKLRCILEDGQEHMVTIKLCQNDPLYLKVEDFGITARQRKNNELLEYEKFPADIRERLDKNFPEMCLTNKISLLNWLQSDTMKPSMTVHTILSNSSVRNNLKATNLEEAFKELKGLLYGS